MHVIRARNVNDAYYAGTRLLAHSGQRVQSRNGPVLRMEDPVTTVYDAPCERVLFDPRRKANPFFHLFEALWMLNGNNDVDTMDQFLASFKEFSDNGETFHGAYGYRWRHWPIKTTTYDQEIDQIARAIAMLKHDPNSRRVVVAMWDPARDLGTASKDIPCNDLIKFSIRDGHLQMTIFCRSNDIIFGAYGANAVHMSVLMEYVAAMIGVPVGLYTQISDDYHAYLNVPYNFDEYYPPIVQLENAYTITASDHRPVKPFPLVANTGTFDRELHDVIEEVRQRSFDDANLGDYTNPFFAEVAQPMYRAFRLYKDGDLNGAINALQDASIRHAYDVDWLLGAEMWLQEIANRRAAKAQPLDLNPPVDPNPDGTKAPTHDHRFAPRDPEPDPVLEKMRNQSAEQPTQHGTIVA